MIYKTREHLTRSTEKLYSILLRKDFSKPDNKTIRRLGMLIDLSSDLKMKEGFQLAIDRASKLCHAKMNDWQKGLLHYFAANAWEGLRHLKSNNGEASCQWHMEEVEKAILNYRLCNQYLRNCAMPRYLCRSNTNLGNVLNTLGRFVEAIELWNRALAIESSFSMAILNKAYGLITYSSSLYDNGHQAVFAKYAYGLFKQGFKDKYIGSLRGLRQDLKRGI